MSDERAVKLSVPADDEELRSFRRLADYAFSSNPPREPDITNMLRQGRENFRLARVGGRIAGGLGIIPMGQWFGGKSVPMAGINAVVIAPEYRSAGIASRLLRAMLSEVRERGYPLSTLYPATQPVYRRVGYEHAGIAMTYKHPLHALDARDRTLAIRAVEEGEEPLLKQLYAEQARRTTGNLDRSDGMWGRVLEAKEAVVHRYLVERDGAPEGYVVYHQEPAGKEKDIVARDLVALTPDAGRRILSFLADHRSVVGNVSWTGSPAEPLLLHVPNQAYRIGWYEQWMLRLVDVRAALEGRGYAEGLEAEVHLDVRDDLLHWNAGRIVLRVSDGGAEVQEGGEGRVRVDVRALAPLYTGYLSPLELQSAGGIEGPEADLRTLGLVFAGPTPWMADGF